MTITLDVKKREELGKAVGKLRDQGIVPGVVYGPKEEPTNISVDKQTFEKVLHEAGESSIIVLKGLDEEKEVLVHEVDFDPARGGVRHVDFYAIERGKELTVNVGLEFIGEAPAEKAGANITKALYDIEVTCLPRNLPNHIDVDLSALEEIGDTIRVSDLVMPEGVTPEHSPEDAVAAAVEAIEEVIEEPEEIDMDAIEVEGETKEGEEGEGAEGGGEEEKPE